MTPLRPHLPILACSAATLALNSCVVKDGSLDFTWWQDAAAPVMNDDVVIENGGGYYHSAPAPERIPSVSIPKAQPKPEPPASPVAQQQPAQSTPPPAPPASQPKPSPRTTAESAVSQQQPAGNTAAPVRYTVRKGDTLSGIARRHGTTVRALVAANGMSDANTTLRINQVLIIAQPGAQPAPRKSTPAAAPIPKPAPAAAKPAGNTSGSHLVQPGDTLYRISRQYGVNPADLMKANGLTPETANTIRAGATLRIPAAR